MRVENAEYRYVDRNLPPYQFIEKIGRTCYKSEDKISENSAVDFCKGLIARGHLSVLEHYWVHMIAPYDITTFLVTHGLNRYCKYIHIYDNGVEHFITASLRTFIDIDNDLGDVLKEYPGSHLTLALNEVKLALPELFKDADIDKSQILASKSPHILNEGEFIKKLECSLATEEILMEHIPRTAWFKVDRGVSHEIVRHRDCSFTQESTRYCNYSKDKFGKEIAVIKPLFYDMHSDLYGYWYRSCLYAEDTYFKLLSKGSSPQEARSVLPNSLKTEVIVTASELEWQHIFNLRALGTTGIPHPQMLEVMHPCFKDMSVRSHYRINDSAVAVSPQ